MLNEACFATALIGLLAAKKERVDQVTGELRFDIDFLARRLLAATDWLAGEPETSTLAVYFGASTGAAVERPQTRAVVSRGVRPDLVGEALARARAPTLLIVGATMRKSSSSTTQR